MKSPFIHTVFAVLIARHSAADLFSCWTPQHKPVCCVWTIEQSPFRPGLVASGCKHAAIDYLTRPRNLCVLGIEASVDDDGSFSCSGPNQLNQNVPVCCLLHGAGAAAGCDVPCENSPNPCAQVTQPSPLN